MKINEKIKFLRETHQWSQEEMAQKLNMSKNGYAKIERGETRSTVQRLEQIANVLNMDICDLLAFGADSHVSFSPNNNHLNYSNIILGDVEQQHYLQIIAMKDEIIQSKDILIQSLQREIELLNEKIKQIQS